MLLLCAVPHEQLPHPAAATAMQVPYVACVPSQNPWLVSMQHGPCRCALPKRCKKPPRTCVTVPVKVPALAAPLPAMFQFQALPWRGGSHRLRSAEAHKTQVLRGPCIAMCESAGLQMKPAEAQRAHGSRTTLRA